MNDIPFWVYFLLLIGVVINFILGMLVGMMITKDNDKEK